MDKYNRIQLAVLVGGVLLIIIGCYFSFNAQTVDARKQYSLVIMLGSLISIGAGCLGLFFMKLRDKESAEESTEIFSQFIDDLDSPSEKLRK